jgi:hypothetical protein
MRLAATRCTEVALRFLRGSDVGGPARVRGGTKAPVLDGRARHIQQLQTVRPASLPYLSPGGGGLRRCSLLSFLFLYQRLYRIP